MSKSPLRNVPLRIFRQYLVRSGLEHIRTTGGHEIWKKKAWYLLVFLLIKTLLIDL